MNMSLFNYLPIGRRINGSMPFVRVLAQVKRKQLCPGFELESSISFSSTKTLRLQQNVLMWKGENEFARVYMCLRERETERERQREICLKQTSGPI